MKATPPRSQRRFEGHWDEILYLYQKILYWFYPVRDRERAMYFSRRLARRLRESKIGGEAIKGQECWALIYEVQGRPASAIKHRKKEIDLIKRLLTIAPRIGGYRVEDLADRLELLAIVYHDAGQLSTAISTLEESRLRCRRAGIPFDGKDLLTDYCLEKKRQS
jgi:hypothetical protein